MENERNDLIDIFCTGGAVYSVQMSYDTMEMIMRDGFIKESDFIPVLFENGSRGAVRKRDINIFSEHMETEEY